MTDLRPADIAITTPVNIIQRFFRETELEEFEDSALTKVTNDTQNITVPGVGLISWIKLRLNLVILCNLPNGGATLAWNTNGIRKLMSEIFFRGPDGVTRFDSVPSVAFDYLDTATVDDGKDQGYATVNDGLPQAAFSKPSLGLPSGGAYGTPYTVKAAVEVRLPFQKADGDPRGILRAATGADADNCEFRFKLNVDSTPITPNLTGDDDWPIGASGGATAQLQSINVVPVYGRREVMNPTDGGGPIVEPDAEFGIAQVIRRDTASLKVSDFNYQQLNTDWAITQLVQYLMQSGVETLGTVDVGTGITSPIVRIHTQYGTRVSPVRLRLGQFIANMHQKTGRYFNFWAHDFRDKPLQTDLIPALRFGFDSDSTLNTGGGSVNSKLVTLTRNYRRIAASG